MTKDCEYDATLIDQAYEQIIDIIGPLMFTMRSDLTPILNPGTPPIVINAEIRQAYQEVLALRKAADCALTRYEILLKYQAGVS